MTSQQYPSSYRLDGSGNPTISFTGPALTNTYDTMGRLAALTENGSTNVISSTSYGPAGELQALSGAWGSESRGYNAMLQMTSLYSGGGYSGLVNKTYNYSGSQNNGKITSETDYVSGETVTYAYDSLNRLATAACGNGVCCWKWGQPDLAPFHTAIFWLLLSPRRQPFARNSARALRPLFAIWRFGRERPVG